MTSGNKWNIDEVIAYLEDKIQSGLSSPQEDKFYEDYKWDNVLSNKKLLKKLKKEMNTYWNQ